MSNETPGEPDLVDQAQQILAVGLPPKWSVERASGLAGPALLLTGPNGAATQLLVEAKARFAPRDIDRLLGGLGRRLRNSNTTRILLVSEYLSPRSRDALTSEDIDYVDLTGNVRIAIEYPSVFINRSGTSPRTRVAATGSVSMRGASFGTVSRFMIDVAPPYSVAEIHESTGVTRGYVSKILDMLDENALVERGARGRVTDVKWDALLRARAAAVDLFTTNSSSTFIAPTGARQLMNRLGEAVGSLDEAVSGSFAAVRLAPIAAPTLLCLYTLRPSADVALDLSLLPADEGADVVVLQPPSASVFALSNVVDGVRWVAASQVAIDCLSGTGRMPSEGEAVLEWMAADEARWRVGSVGDYPTVKSNDRT